MSPKQLLPATHQHSKAPEIFIHYNFNTLEKMLLSYFAMIGGTDILFKNQRTQFLKQKEKIV